MYYNILYCFALAAAKVVNLSQRIKGSLYFILAFMHFIFITK